MGILENSIGAMFGQGPGGNDGPSFGGSAYAPMATALIGLLAAKAMTGGFGNLGGLFGGGGQPAQQPQPQGGYGQAAPEPQGGGGLLGGLGGLLHQFQQNGMGNVAQSWVGSGPNQPASPTQVTQALGPEIIQQLVQKTGMSEQQILQQLSQELPSLVDKLTPQGRLPTHQEASSFLNGGNPLNPG
jgi:uncharacterized protein YidB (DUF937 family)